MAIEPLPTPDARHVAGPVRVGEDLDRLLRRLGAPKTSTLAGLHQRWEEVAGAALAAHTRPIRVRDGALVVAVDDPAWAAELRWMTAELAERARSVLNDDSIDRIEVRVEGGDRSG